MTPEEIKELRKPRYRVPRVTVDADVSLDEFAAEDIAAYLRHLGYYVSSESFAPHDQDGDPENVLDPDELEHIAHLHMCGQTDAARLEALALIGNAIGRSLQ